MVRGRPRRASDNRRRSSSARSVETEPGTGGGKWLHIAISMKPYVVVFTASACVLIIEIVAARILAPTIGVSLYTWTGIIGVVLAGISAGNYLGGRVADRFPSGITLGIILLAGGASSISVLALVNVVSEAFDALSAIPRIIFDVTPATSSSRPCSCSAPRPSRRGGVPACGNVWAGGAGCCDPCAKYTAGG